MCIGLTNPHKRQKDSKMPLVLDVNREEFYNACQKAESIEDLMEGFKLSREQEKHLRRRLKANGRSIPSLQNRRNATNVVETMPDMTAWERARAVLGGHVRYCQRSGDKLDGKHATVQQIIKESGLTLSP